MAQLQIKRIGYALGAEVRGIDLSRPLDVATVAEIRRAWLEHLLLCFPDQVLDGEQLTALASRFGDELDDNNRSPLMRDPGNHYILFNTNKPINGRQPTGYKAGQNWHSDRSFTESPDVVSLLLAKEIPEVGGDTMFTNMYMAYETLSPALQGILDRLEALHDSAKIKNYDQRGAEEAAEFRRDNPPVAHPVVKVHPETGRKALYVGERVSKFVGLTEEESAPLLSFLTKHAVQYEFNYRHRWKVNDLLMWDNRCLMHIALSDYDRRQPRHMLRCTVLGPKSGKRHARDEDSVPVLAG